MINLHFLQAIERPEHQFLNLSRVRRLETNYLVGALSGISPPKTLIAAALSTPEATFGFTSESLTSLWCIEVKIRILSSTMTAIVEVRREWVTALGLGRAIGKVL